MTLRIAFTGGGTGGHIYPALAIDGALRARHPGAYDARFFGNRGGLEASLVTTMPLSFVPSAALQRRLSLGTLRTAFANAAGVFVALRGLARFRPAMVVATGGYVCFPVVVAARVLRLLRVARPRIALLEINAVPGLTNRLLAPLVDEVWATYAASAASFGAKTVVTGTPTRASLRSLAPAEVARERLGLDPARTTVVVMGGSQGARSINQAVVELVTERTLPPDWQVLHVSGERDHASMDEQQRRAMPGNRVRLVPYLPDPADAYAAADVVVARAGASTLAELAVTATPAVLVPYPFAAEQHQARNAALFAAGGAAVVMTDDALDGERLLETLRTVLEPARNAAMRTAARSLVPPDAAGTIAERIARATGTNGARVAGAVSANEQRP
ncbi:MAG: UDP-N-acetylglucosamine--N-acetylmuramyl-(pentapeptide) pyrophosphoryl-undecaprenol [Candidatus Eremiobacteraeota bacterium]|nr:UDP-N-acetylglucosamine--N-acetylmuramyl-(pentapeptide) pyrophosphoryl-undecaprenol [Candidatus Eremiobacteraeota bacterium]